MRLVVVGAGAVGGVVGARLAQAGHDVTFVARGPHLAAIRADGLTVESPGGTDVVRVPAGDELPAGPIDAVLLAVKGQDTVGALGAALDVPVVCLQNGVANEREALRRSADVYGVPVMLPATHLEPGVVQQWSWPTPGILDVGRWPGGVDERCEALAGAFRSAGFESVARPDIGRWKHSKLLMNLGNAAEAAFGDRGEIAALARREGRDVLQAADVPYASREEDRERRGDILSIGEITGRHRQGGSTWQSLARGSGVEVDLLNGEIVLVARLHGLDAPVNAALQRAVHEMAAAGERPASRDGAAFLSRFA
jgi:2-dehydropantoate 2-reductase